jgi:hypothetical protein
MAICASSRMQQVRRCITCPICIFSCFIQRRLCCMCMCFEVTGHIAAHLQLFASMASNFDVVCVCVCARAKRCVKFNLRPWHLPPPPARRAGGGKQLFKVLLQTGIKSMRYLDCTGYAAQQARVPQCDTSYAYRVSTMNSAATTPRAKYASLKAVCIVASHFGCGQDGHRLCICSTCWH